MSRPEQNTHHQSPSPPEPAAKAGGSATRVKAIIVNTLSSYARDVVDIATFLVLTPFLIQVLGKETFGLWSLIWSLISLFALADMGFGTSVVKYVADARGRGDLQRIRSVVCTLFWIYAGLGALLMALVGGSAIFFNEIFDIPPEKQEVARVVLLLLGARSALCLPLGMFRGVLIGYQKMRVANAYKVLASLAYFGSVLLVLGNVSDIRWLAILNMIMGVLPMLAMLFHAKFTLPGTSLHPRNFDPSIVREASSFSLYFFLIQLSSLIFTRVDSVIIQKVLTLEMVAVYAIAMRLSERAHQFCSQLVKSLTPVVAELHGAGDHRNIEAIWKQGTKLTVAFAVPLLVGLIVLADPLIRSWAGPGFEEAIPVCRWLVAAVLVAVIHSNSSNVLSMTGHHRYLALTMIGAQLANVALSIVLIHRMGILGVALATYIVQIPMSVLLHQGRAGKLFNIHHWEFYRQTVFPSLLPAAGMIGFLLLAQRWLPFDSILAVGALELAGMIVFLSLYWLMGFDDKEREYFQTRVLRKFRRRSLSTS